MRWATALNSSRSRSSWTTSTRSSLSSASASATRLSAGGVSAPPPPSASDSPPASASAAGAAVGGAAAARRALLLRGLLVQALGEALARLHQRLGGVLHRVDVRACQRVLHVLEAGLDLVLLVTGDLVALLPEQLLGLVDE